MCIRDRCVLLYSEDKDSYHCPGVITSFGISFLLQREDASDVWVCSGPCWHRLPLGLNMAGVLGISQRRVSSNEHNYDLLHFEMCPCPETEIVPCLCVVQLPIHVHFLYTNWRKCSFTLGYNLPPLVIKARHLGGSAICWWYLSVPVQALGWLSSRFGIGCRR